MTKINLVIVAIVLSLTAQSHTFITEILVNENPNQLPTSSPYNTVQSYTFTESEIMDAYDEVIYSVSDRIKLETLKQVIPTTETIEVIRCDDPRRKTALQKGATEKTCGQFDHFNAARTAAIKTCHSLNNNNPGLYPSGLIPRFSGPATFVDLDTAAVDHHSVYHVSHGLQFSCVEILLMVE